MGRNVPDQDESHVSVIVVIALAIMAITFVFVIPILGIAYGDMKTMTHLATEQYKVMKEETRKTRELRAQILSGEQ